MSFLICDISQDSARITLIPKKKTRTQKPGPYISETLKSHDLTKDLLTLFHKVLSLGNVKSSELEAIGFVKGPGPFTSLRILINLIQTLNFLYPALPIYGCSKFLPLALCTLQALTPDKKQPVLSEKNGESLPPYEFILLVIAVKGIQGKSYVQYFSLERSTLNAPFPPFIPHPLGEVIEVDEKTLQTPPPDILEAWVDASRGPRHSSTPCPVKVVIGSDHPLESALTMPPAITLPSGLTAQLSLLTTFVEPNLLPIQTLITLFEQEHHTGHFNLKTTYPHLRPLYIRKGYTPSAATPVPLH